MKWENAQRAYRSEVFAKKWAFGFSMFFAVPACLHLLFAEWGPGMVLSAISAWMLFLSRVDWVTFKVMDEELPK